MAGYVLCMQLSAAVYIPAPAGTPEAAAAEQLMQQCVTAVARGQDTPNDMTSSTSTSNLITHSAGEVRSEELICPSSCRLSCAGLTVSLLYANHHAREGHALLRQYMADQDLGDRDPTPPTPQPAYDQLYPINALRNLALEIADSPLVLPLDADFVPSRGAAAQVGNSCQACVASITYCLLYGMRKGLQSHGWSYADLMLCAGGSAHGNAVTGRGGQQRQQRRRQQQ